jgi:hypothetical protein
MLATVLVAVLATWKVKAGVTVLVEEPALLTCAATATVILTVTELDHHEMALCRN